MKLGKGDKVAMGLNSLFKDKQNPVLMIALIVVILVAVFFVARMMFFSGPSYEESAAPPAAGMPGEGWYPGMPGPGSPAPGPGAPPGPNAGPPGMPPPPPPPGASPGPAGGGAPAASPAPPASAPKPAAQPKPAPASPSPSPARKPDSRAAADVNKMKVFGSVTVSYPKGWGVDPSSASSAAIFTDGKAVFEVRPPDPKATTAKAIAASALKTMAKGGMVIAQAADKVSGYDAYWYAVKLGGRTVRIVGIDAPTRIAIKAYVRAGDFAAYRDTFNKMQAAITFR